MKLGFVDTETTGTNPHYHEVWEIGLVLVDTARAETEQRIWQVPFVNVERLDPEAEKVNNFSERYEPISLTSHGVAEALYAAVAGVRLASCNIAFDTAFLREFLYREKLTVPWHYSPIDVKSMCYGRDPSLIEGRTDDLLEAAGIEKDEHRHTALGDAWLAMRLYQWATASDR